MARRVKDIFDFGEWVIAQAKTGYEKGQSGGIVVLAEAEQRPVLVWVYLPIVNVLRRRSTHCAWHTE
ncbi:MAG TPA: hypothetical protein VEX68_12565 [Bryobacteraceae bacterium]|nr:hypothetical protein [Bryobacteraceae bacterium]